MLLGRHDDDAVRVAVDEVTGTDRQSAARDREVEVAVAFPRRRRRPDPLSTAGRVPRGVDSSTTPVVASKWVRNVPYTLAEKILLAHCDADDVSPGDIVMVRCDVVMTNDISGPMAFRAMEKMGAERVFDPAKVVVVPDHFVPAQDTRSAELQKLMREWSRAQGVAYYEQGRGGAQHSLHVE